MTHTKVRDIGPRAYQKHRHDRDRLVIMPRHRPICWQAIGPGLSKTHPARPAKRGLDPDKWFNNVEIVVGEKIGTETTTYVRNIYKYYVAYRLTLEAQPTGQQAREQVAPRKTDRPPFQDNLTEPPTAWGQVRSFTESSCEVLRIVQLPASPKFSTWGEARAVV